MKKCEKSLLQYLENNDDFVTNDLYTIRLSDGTEYDFVEGDADIIVGNKKFNHAGPIFVRDQTRISGSPSVDTLSVNIISSIDDGKNDGGMNILAMAHAGRIDDCSVELQRAYFDPNTNTLVGTLKLFKGEANVQSAGGTDLKLEVKSKTTGLSQLYPVRIYAPGTAYVMNENGVVISSSTDEVTCAIPLKPSQNILSRGVF